MISKFFIHRPVFASVLSIVIVLAGLMAMRSLPIAQYPDIVPPEVVVTTSYPGASAEVIAESVAAPLEQEINGVEDMLYIVSTNSDSGTLQLQVIFAIGTDPEQATINVNNRVQAALTRLPEEVRRQGVRVQKRSSSILQVVTLYSDDGRYDPIYLSNYALLNVIDELKRTPGVGDASIFGSKDYSMRIWLEPDLLAQYNLSPAEVAAAVREQNSQFAAGKFGAEPSNSPTAFTYTVSTPGRLATEEQFANIILRTSEDGATLRLGDVARIELGAQNYGTSSAMNGFPAVGIPIYLQPGANALETAQAIKETMERLSAQFPEGVKYAIPFDTTLFVDVAVHEVIKTFIEAIILVVLIVYLFLQNWRATLIPILAVPVSLIGTFAGLYLLGFSINLLTLFGMILAIGIVVDDAIVVLENVERIMRTEGLGRKAAAEKAMEEVSGPVIAIVLVLCAVFVPVGFLGGLTGIMYKQFAITIALSVTISGIVALTLSPALCGILLKEGHHEPIAPFRWFNRQFDRVTNGYIVGVRFFLKRAILGLVIFAAIIGSTYWIWQKLPSALVPEEDQGYLFSIVMLPPAASLDRTQKIVEAVTEHAAENPAIAYTVAFAGFDLLSRSNVTSSGTIFMTLNDWSEREGPGQSAPEIAGATSGFGYTAFDNAIAVAFNAPPITGLSITGGFEGYLQNRSGSDRNALSAELQKFVEAATARPEIGSMQTTLNTNVPRYKVEVDREKARSMGVSIDDIYSTMQSTFGSLYVNDFTLFGRNYQVSLQSEEPFRRTPEDLRQVFVRANTGSLVPLSSLLLFDRTTGPDTAERFNVFPAAKVQGAPAPGYSSGQALDALEEVAAEVLPEGYNLAWSGASYQERATQDTAGLAFVFGIIMVFLILAAQYERWSLPFAVITAVPFAIFGAALAVWMRGLQNDIYFQIGLLVLIGLAAKNAILIVEFAVMKRQQGLSRWDAALEAARLRFRPIVMTSLAFILGCVPLAISSGAGAGSRHSIGTGVIGGMLVATFIAIFFIPLFYRLIDRIGTKNNTSSSS